LKYVLDLHPSIDSGDITLITNQDKVQMNAIVMYLKFVGHFHGSWHQHQNIIKMCGECGGKIPHSTLWVQGDFTDILNVFYLSAHPSDGARGA